MIKCFSVQRKNNKFFISDYHLQILKMCTYYFNGSNNQLNNRISYDHVICVQIYNNFFINRSCACIFIKYLGRYFKLTLWCRIQLLG